MKRKTGDAGSLKRSSAMADKMASDWPTRNGELSAYVTAAKQAAQRVAAKQAQMKAAAARMKAAIKALAALYPKLDAAEKALKAAEASGDKAEIAKQKKLFEALDAQGFELQGTIGYAQGDYWGRAFECYHESRNPTLTEPKP